MTTQHWRGLGALCIAAAAAVLGSVAIGAAAQAHPAGGAPLQVASGTVIPGTNGHRLLVAAEASDGDVFVAVPTSSLTDDIDVAVGAHATSVVETVPAGTVAIAASGSQLFVAGRHEISSFSRHSGAILRTWMISVPKFQASFGGALVYGAGRLWAIGTRGHGAKVFELNPHASHVRAVGSAHHVSFLAVGRRGVYFVRSGGHTLIRVAPNGSRVTAPTHEAVNEHLSGPGAVQVIAIDGNTLLVSHDAGQGLDAQLIRYNASTLARISAVSTDVAHTSVVPTVDGDLVLFNQTGGDGCSTAANPVCVASIATTTAATSNAVALPSRRALSVLLGPKPAVVVSHGGHARLIRLIRLH